MVIRLVQRAICWSWGHVWVPKIRNIGDDYHWRMVCNRCRLWGSRVGSGTTPT